MAKQLYVEVIDDIDSTPIEDGGEHIEFTVNGSSYEIDLGDDNALEFHRKLDYYIRHASPVGGKSGGRSAAITGAAKPGRDPGQTRAIRDWANSNGYEVSTRGRIPAEIEKAFDAAH